MCPAAACSRLLPSALPSDGARSRAGGLWCARSWWPGAAALGNSVYLLTFCSPAVKEQGDPEKEGRSVKTVGQALQRQSGFNDDNAKWLTPAKGKKSLSKKTSVELSSSGEVEEDSWEMEEEEEDGSSEELMDDYGALSSEEEEVRTFWL